MVVEYNKGNIAEAILASAVGARFKKRFKSSDFNGKSDESVKIGNLPLVGIHDIREVLGQVVKGPVSFTVKDFDRKTKKEVDITFQLVYQYHKKTYCFYKHPLIGIK